MRGFLFKEVRQKEYVEFALRKDVLHKIIYDDGLLLRTEFHLPCGLIGSAFAHGLAWLEA